MLLRHPFAAVDALESRRLMSVSTAAASVPGASISGYLWNDTNGNSVRDGIETLTGARTVFLDTNGNKKLDSNERQVNASADSVYTFSNLAAGSYKVTRVYPSGYKMSNNTVGYVTVTVTAGQALTGVNIGTTGQSVVLVPTPPQPQPGSISGRLWNDADGDGILDAVETGVSNGVVFLDANANNLLDAGEVQTTTDANGAYRFDNVLSGSYRVATVVPSGYQLTNLPSGFLAVTVGNAQAVVSADIGTVAVRPPPTPVNSTPNFPTVRILPLGDSITKGNQASLSGGFVPGGYRTTLFNQLQATGLSVDFVGSDNLIPSPSLTLAGETQHEGHPNYTASQILANLTGDDKTVGNNGGYWLDGLGARGQVTPDYILLHIGTNDIRFGATLGELAARIDGILDTLTTLRPDAVVMVAGIIPNLESVNRNNAVLAYNAYVQSTLVPAYQTAGAHVQFVDMYHLFVDANGVPIPARLPDKLHPDKIGYDAIGQAWANAVQADILARGFTPTPPVPGSITGRLWNDSNSDGIQDATETGVANAAVFLDANLNNVLDAGETRATTDANGVYHFDGVMPGNHHVATVIPTGYKMTNSSAGYLAVTVGDGQAVSSADIGTVNTVPVIPPPVTPTGQASISGKVFAQASKWNAAAAAASWTVFLDANKNGLLDAGEIYTAAKSDLTYSFAGLAAGTYTVALQASAGWNIVTPASKAFNLTLKATTAKTGQNFVVAKS